MADPMSPDLPAALPASMVEAAARAIWKQILRVEGMGHPDLDERWAQPWMDREPWIQRATAVLAAALAECEVRQQFLIEIDRGDGRGWRMSPPPLESVVIFPSEQDRDRAYRDIVKPKKRKVDRLVITTKPVPVASPVDTPREEPRS